MMGDSAQGEVRDSGKQVPGLYVLAAQDIFDFLEKVRESALVCLIYWWYFVA